MASWRKLLEPESQSSSAPSSPDASPTHGRLVKALRLVSEQAVGHVGIPGMDRLYPVLEAQLLRKLAAVDEASLQSAIEALEHTLRWTREGDGGA